MCKALVYLDVMPMSYTGKPGLFNSKNLILDQCQKILRYVLCLLSESPFLF